MKRVASGLLTVVACGLLGPNLLITQDAALVGGALSTLKFESAPGKEKVIGGPPKFKITKATLDYLTELHKSGKTIEVQNNGAIKVLEK